MSITYLFTTELYKPNKVKYQCKAAITSKLFLTADTTLNLRAQTLKAQKLTYLIRLKGITCASAVPMLLHSRDSDAMSPQILNLSNSEKGKKKQCSPAPVKQLRQLAPYLYPHWPQLTGTICTIFYKPQREQAEQGYRGFRELHASTRPCKLRKIEKPRSVEKSFK